MFVLLSPLPPDSPCNNLSIVRDHLSLPVGQPFLLLDFAMIATGRLLTSPASKKNDNCTIHIMDLNWEARRCVPSLIFFECISDVIRFSRWLGGLLTPVVHKERPSITRVECVDGRRWKTFYLQKGIGRLLGHKCVSSEK